ncbi:hypothetical protein NEOLEDRAFT_118956 [Neolentinus lepideus HHB14362 ss-1]|uniref:Secreted protein n=1 Tax=Neolentinus lepideus HHB14362 ss-1 TaxID=1314782 RepID=A0A165MTZ3_9AGAM|nr:hypothetical protein NEOLEDRAFT_118956 [Neolentinus lepideus HHB14362 ss-1]
MRILCPRNYRSMVLSSRCLLQISVLLLSTRCRFALQPLYDSMFANVRHGAARGRGNKSVARQMPICPTELLENCSVDMIDGLNEGTSVRTSCNRAADPAARHFFNRFAHSQSHAAPTRAQAKDSTP